MDNELVERAGKAFDKYIALYSRHKALEIAYKEKQAVQSTVQSAADASYSKSVGSLDTAHSKGMKAAASARDKMYKEAEADTQEAHETYEAARTETEAWQAEVKDTENILVGIPEASPSGGRTNLGRSM